MLPGVEYHKMVIDYCNNKDGNQSAIKEHIVAVSCASNQPEYAQPFNQIMLGIDTVLGESEDCKKLLNALRLLSIIHGVAPDHILQIWKAKLAQIQRFVNFFGHYFSQVLNPCNTCNAINKTAISLCRKLTRESPMISSFPIPSQPMTFAGATHVTKTTKRYIPCAACKVSGHFYCKNCLAAQLNRAIGSKKTSITCIRDGITVNPEWHANLQIMDNETAKQHCQLVKDSETEGRVEINCPNCHQVVYYYPQQFWMFAECVSCDSAFCTNCFNPYHGGTDCPSTTTINQHQEVGNFNHNSNAKIEASIDSRPLIPAPQESFGAAAMPYELDFYKQDDKRRSSFEPEDIAAAFTDISIEHVSSALSNKVWPWEMDRPLYRFHEFIHPFESLQAGNWVEDEILERAMKNLIKSGRVQENVCILESFVINWSMMKSYEDGEFIRLVREKNLLDKDLVFTLINTDMKGHGGHWILGAIHVKENTIILFDSSLVLSSTFYQKFFFTQLHVMHVAAKLENSELDLSKWKLVVSLDSVQQQNAYDCGTFVVANFYSLITENVQLNRVPNSANLRSWIFDSVRSIQESGWQAPNPQDKVEPEPQISVFTPTALRIEYKYLSGKQIFCKNRNW